MILRLALRNLLHDRIRFAATLVGLVFSTSLITIQLGLYISSERMIATLIDRSQADLWMVPRETRSFENGAMLPGRERYLALSTPGIAAATEVVVSFAEWRKPSGGGIPMVLVGAEPGNGGPALWNVAEGSMAACHARCRCRRPHLPSRPWCRRARRRGRNLRSKARVAAVTRGIRSFTTLPYVFTSLAGARGYLGLDRHRSTYVLLRLRRGPTPTGCAPRCCPSCGRPRL